MFVSRNSKAVQGHQISCQGKVDIKIEIPLERQVQGVSVNEKQWKGLVDWLNRQNMPEYGLEDLTGQSAVAEVERLLDAAGETVEAYLSH